MWLVSGLLINIAIQLICAKGHHKQVHRQLHKESVPRFTIPHPSHPDSAFIPEATTVGHQRASIVGTELPGAYGEDYDMETAYESGSGIVSGSGSGSEKDNESPESPGKYGTNLVHNPPPSNPSAAFVSHMNETGDEDEEKEEPDVAKSNDEGQSHTDAPVTPPPTPKVVSTKKVQKIEKIEKSKATKKIEKHKAKPEKVHKVARRKPKIKQKSHEENNMISKIDAIAKQIERVEHRERLDRKEAATLKVAKKVAKKVIKNIAAKKKHKKRVRKVHKAIEETSDEGEKTSEVAPKKEIAPTTPEEPAASTTVDAGFKYWMNALRKESPTPKLDMHGPEGFECPWACFWTCHSYCPKECCNNPFKCDLACREFCTPYCSDRCCAPGSQRLPKLQLNFNADEERKNISAIFSEDDKHQNPTNSSSISKGAENEDARHHSMLDPAENSYQQLKEQEHQIAIASQIEALKKATSYAAHLMGLPPECPLACARICLPGLCKQQCCTRSEVPGLPIVPSSVSSFQSTAPIDLHHSSSFSPSSSLSLSDSHNAPAMSVPGATSNLAAPAMVPGPQVTPSRNQLALANQYAMARKQQYLLAHNGLFPSNTATAYQPFASANNYMMNKLAYQNRLLEGKNDFVPALAQYRAMQYANQINRQKMLLKKNLQAQASRQQIADASKLCPSSYSSACQSPPSWLHNCPPICRSSCIPQCPNECCLHSTSATAESTAMK